MRSVVEKIEGSVLLVGHSYGGAVITVAGAADNVVGLVYLSGYALEEGESLGQLQGGFPDSELAANLVYTPFPNPGAEDGTDVSVKVEAFPQVFAAGIDPAISEVLAVAQRPLAALAFSEAAPVAAWKTKPAFGIVSAADHTINPDVERFGYTRGNFRRVIELDAPHLVMRALPQDVIQFIVEAAAEVV
nr:alpha/beta hydrolase [Microbacterium sp. 4-7]